MTVPAPAPPQGPGVQPPFPAPPVEGRGKRIGLALGVAGGVLVLVCGGGVAALIGLSVSMTGALTEQTHAAVSHYLDAVKDKDYDKAYGELCDSAQKRETPAEFRSRLSAEKQIADYKLGETNMVTGSVPVDVTYADGGSAELTAELDQDAGTGAFELCELSE